MVLDGEIFGNLCNLYPETAKSLKFRALDRRNFFLKHMQNQEKELGVGVDYRTGLRDKAVERMKDEFILEDEVQDYSKVQLFRAEVDQVPEGKGEANALGDIKESNRLVQNMKLFLESMKKDFEDGSLVRKKVSSNPVELISQSPSKKAVAEKEEADPIYLYFQSKDEESSGSEEEDRRGEGLSAINSEKDTRARSKSEMNDTPYKLEMNDFKD